MSLTDLPSVVPLLATNAARVLGSARVTVHSGEEDSGAAGDRGDDGAGVASPTVSAAAAAAGAIGGGDDSWGRVDVGPWDFGQDPPAFLTMSPAEPTEETGTSSTDGVTSRCRDKGLTADAAATGGRPAADGHSADRAVAEPAEAASTADRADCAAAALPTSSAVASADSAGHSVATVSKPRWPHFIVGSDVLYSESLIGPLLRGVESLMGPSTVAILANERRCEDTYEAFVQACKEQFRVRAVPRKQMPTDAPASMFILELRLKRHR